MASKFVLTAQLQLQAPTNVRQVVSLVNKQLQGIKMNINPVVNTKALAQANGAIQKISVSAKGASKSLNSAAGSAANLGSALGAAARRFASITLATGFFLALTRAVGSAVGRAVEFEKEMLKISQVTGRSVRDLSNLSKEVTHLATTFGAGSDEILNAARALSQAGFSAQKVTGMLKTLAQTDLAATFDNIKDTTEGAIAVLSQFRKEVRAAGGEVAFLEKAMDSINAVSKSFAVESADLISVVRRTGGVFEAAGGSLNELIALFTSVRSTTRETADTIATGFRTIFTRIQRTETIDQLKELGIVLQDSTGKFVGPMEAIKRLSAGLKALDPRDFRFNQIVEQLGGFRQIGKVIPLIKKFQISTEALAVANNSLGSTARDAATAQQGLGNQFAQLKEKFDATIRSMTDSDTFKTLATSAIKMAEAILRIVDALEPLLPMLTALMAFKMGQIMLPALGKFSGMGGKHEGGRIHGFAGGGMVPGRGNKDTIPAMLQPGEFVMRKSAVKKIGSDNMAQMNNGYAAGGTVTRGRATYGNIREKNFGAALLESNDGKAWSQDDIVTLNLGHSMGDRMGKKELEKTIPLVQNLLKKDPETGKKPKINPSTMERIFVNEVAKTPRNVARAGPTEEVYEGFLGGVEDGLIKGTNEGAKKVGRAIDATPTKVTRQSTHFFDNINEAAKGNMFEQVLNSFAGKGHYDTKSDPQSPFDFTKATFAGSKNAFSGTLGTGVAEHIEAKSSQDLTSAAHIGPKIVNQMAFEAVGDKLFHLEAAKIIESGRVTDIEDVKSFKESEKAKKLGTKQNTLLNAVKLKMGARHYGGRIGKYAEGGKTDTVSAMLTPGEFVIKKSAAQGIGYSNLHRMNQSNGVNGYAAGGIVKGYAAGGIATKTRGYYQATPMSGAGGLPPATGGAAASGGMKALGANATAAAAQLLAMGLAAETTGIALRGIIDDITRIPAAIASLATALTEAAAGITPIDNILREAVTTSAGVLTTAFTEASTGVRMVDDILLEAVTTSVASLREGMINASAGISQVDDILKAQVSGSVTALTEGMVNASTGISQVDDILRAAVVTAVASLEAAMIDASAGIRKVDDILLQGITAALAPLKAAMVAFSQGLIESDGVLATGIAAMVDLPKTVDTFQAEMIKLTTIFTTVEAAMVDLPGMIEKFQLTLTGMAATNTVAIGAQGVSNAAVTAKTLATQGLTIATQAEAVAAQTETAVTQQQAGVGIAEIIMTEGLIAAIAMESKTKVNAFTAIFAEAKAKEDHANVIRKAIATSAKSQVADMTKTSVVQQHKTALIKAVSAQGGLDALSPSVQTALKKYMAALNKRSVTLETQAAAPMGMMAGAGAKMSGVGGGMKAAGAGVMSGGAGQGMMMAGMMMPMVTQMAGMEGPMADAITQFGMLAAMLPMVLGSFTEMIGSVVAGVGAKLTEIGASKSAAAAEFAESAASGVSATADTGEAGASGVSAAADTTEAAASGLASASIAIFALALAAIIGVMMYFKAVAREAADEASDMGEALKSGKENFTLQDIQGKRAEAVGAEDTADSVLKAGMGGALTGAAIGMFFGPIGAGIGAAIGAGIGIAWGVWGSAARDSMDPVIMASNELSTVQYYAATAQRDYANAQKEAMMLELKGVALARHQIKASKQLGQDGKKAADAMKRFSDIQMITSELSEDEMSETMKESLEDSEKGLRELTQVYFKAASDSKAALSSLTEEMFEGGKNLGEIMGSVEVQGLLNDIFAKAKTGFTMQLAAEGFGRKDAMADLGFNEDTDLSQNTAAGRANSAQLEALVLQKQQNEATKLATETTKAQRKAIFDEGKARHEAIIAARIELNAKLALAAQARATAKALAALDGALLGAKQMTENMSGAIAAANGEFKAVKRNITGFLQSDDKATRQEGFAAAGSLLGPAGAAQAQSVNIKLDKLDKMDQIMRVQGLTEFTGGTDALGNQAQSFDDLDKFLIGFGIDISSLAPALQEKITTMMENGLDPTEINEIMEMFREPIEAERDAIIKLVQMQEEYLKQYDMASSALIKAKQAEIKGNVKMTKIFARGQERLAEAQGTPLTSGQKQANRVRGQQAGLQGTGVRAGSVRGAQQAIARNRAEMQANAARLRAVNLSAVEIGNLTMRQKELAASSAQVTSHLEELADQSARAADIMSDIDKERSGREAVAEKAKDFTFAGNEERQKMNMGMKALARVLETGTLNSIPEEFRSVVGALLDDFKDVKITRTGMTGGQVSKQLQIRALDQNARRVRGRGLTAEEIKNIFESTTKEDKLIDDLRKLNKEEMAAQQVLNNILRSNTTQTAKLLKEIGDLITAINATLPAGGAGPMHGGLIQGFAEGGTTKAARYKSSPKNMFQPRGTDTVPAMLTPGEFVMQKSAVDSIGAANLSAMNKGKPIYRAAGGFVARTGDVVGSGINNLLKGFIAKGINDSGLPALGRAWAWSQGNKNPNENAQLAAERFIAALPENVGPNFPKMIKAVTSVGELDNMRTVEAVKLNPWVSWARPFHAAQGIAGTGTRSPELKKAIQDMGMVFPRISRAWGGKDVDEFIGSGRNTFKVLGMDNGIATGLGLYTGGAMTKRVNGKKGGKATGISRIVDDAQAIALMQGAGGERGNWMMPPFTTTAGIISRKSPEVVEAWSAKNPTKVKDKEKMSGHFTKTAYNLGLNSGLFKASKLGAAESSITRALGKEIHRGGGGNQIQVVQKVLESQKDVFTAGPKEKALIAMFDPMGAVHIGETQRFMDLVQNKMKNSGNTQGYFQKNFSSFAYEAAGGWTSQMIARKMGVPLPPPDMFLGVVGQEQNLGAAGIKRNQMGLAGAAMFATGGPVEGGWKAQGTDTVPAMLTPGEFVMKKSAVDKYGTGFMSAVNSGVQGFKGGGIVGGESEEDKAAFVQSNITEQWVLARWDAMQKELDRQRKVDNEFADAKDPIKMNERRVENERKWDNIINPPEAKKLQAEYDKIPDAWFREIMQQYDAKKARDLNAAIMQDKVERMLDLVFGDSGNEHQRVAPDTGKPRSLPGPESRDAVGFAVGGPVLPPGQWESQTPMAVNVNDIMNQIRNKTGMDYGMDNLPSLGAGLYKSTANAFGRGVWGTLTNDGNYNDLLAPTWRPIDNTVNNLGRPSARGSALMLGGGKNAGGGSIRAFSVTRGADILGINVGGHQASIPNFGVSGPFDFEDGGTLAWNDFSGAPLAKMTGPMFAAQWAPYAYNFKGDGGKGLPGGSGFGSQTNDGITFSGKTRKLANMMLEQAIKSKQWDPLSGGRLGQRIQAGWITGIPEWAQDAAKEAFPNPAFGTRHQEAMLKSATIGTQNQHYFASGGAARGTDTVPAMLTPGEFVMKKSAVDKYGTGFMSAINNGVQRFATGGPVQYLQGGSNKPVSAGSGGDFGFIGDIVSSISDSLSAFTRAFGLFSGLSDMLSRTINDMASMTIKHNIKIHGTLHIPGFSQSAINNIVNTIANEVVDGVDEKIKQAFDKRDRKNDKRT